MKRNLIAAITLLAMSFGAGAQAATYRTYHHPEHQHQQYWNGRNDHDDRDRDRAFYHDRDDHVGRSVAIIGGSAAAGAAIGAAADHGEGAAVGALIGGVAGFVADQATRHHDR